MRRGGFTIIELMVVITIILILAGGSVAAYLNFNKVESINNDARAVQGEIVRVKSLAASLEYPTGCTNLRGYRIESQTVQSKLTGVRVTAECSSGNIVYGTKQILTSSEFGSAFSLLFVPGSGYLEGGVTQNVVLTHPTDAELSRTISIGGNGIIINQ